MDTFGTTEVVRNGMVVELIAPARASQSLILFQIRVTATYPFLADITLKLRFVSVRLQFMVHRLRVNTATLASQA